MMAMCLAVQVVTLFDVVLYHLFPFLKARNDDDESMIIQRALVRSFALQRVLKIKLKNERTNERENKIKVRRLEAGGVYFFLPFHH